MNLDKEENSLNGFLIIDKPSGITSHSVVHQIRKVTNTKKVGHAGTLDPDATGVLVVGLGKATRLITYLVSDNKTYQATIRLGQSTSTDDREGEILKTVDCSNLDENEINSVILNFIGDIDQIPSAVSAIKINGQKAYDLVRKGEKVELKPRKIHISAIDIHEIKKVNSFIDLNLTIHCSSGTYIRALARDIGEQLKVGGHVTNLRRLQSGQWNISDAKKIEELKVDNLPLISMAEIATTMFPSVKVEFEEIQDLIHGRYVRKTHEPAETIALIDKKPSLVALAHGDGVMLKPQIVFATGISGV